ncbi:Tn7 transposase TnsA N-terminal domain-containing protein [Rhizobium sp. NTR19]|uniref:Tn7 transposase TnsA N-terminal domain-containing protein n=1 Tax=Neorhizobium turbinariae TaxID=2937795 RepID=A0ABT0ISL8_9HYPH|nr:Tn7 transposase TnsA N-terminal domain-containing protein [Neorhizobium turbinariae]MCK8780804.1 Tn7 transposase TnsA N-terminal domain-containing protein [Neorhizobium turbinariae]
MRPEHHIKRFLLETRHGVRSDYRIPEQTTYLRPSVEETFERPPRPSCATRRPSDKSPFNTRARPVNPLNHTEMLMESSLEQRFSGIMLAKDVVEMREQWPRVTYVDHAGVKREHTFDLWLKKRSGKRVSIAVKPEKKIPVRVFISMLAAIWDQGCLEGIADDVSFTTEHFASEAAAANAEWILFARRARNDADVEEARELLKTVTGQVRFGELMKDLDIQAHRRAALWCLIDEGWLRPVEQGVIEDYSLMEVVPLPGGSCR